MCCSQTEAEVHCISLLHVTQLTIFIPSFIIRALLPWLAVQLCGVACYKFFMDRIPNSKLVTSPCDPTQDWNGVGHRNPQGGGDRSQFGLDFKDNNLQWTEAMCKRDSDGDGRSNGEELGDPECMWTPNNDVILDTSSVTHPGICEPLESAECQSSNDWLDCDAYTFNCPAIHQPGVQNLTIRFPEQAVPVVQTFHTCMIVELPSDGDFHILGSQAFLDNTRVMHHVLLYGCPDGSEPERPLNEPYECGLNFDPACPDTLASWVLGAPGECLHDNAGFRIGTQGYKIGGIQLHWENPDLAPSERDSSGMTIYYTHNTRMYDAGFLWVGSAFMEIPPGETSYVETGSCAADCTSRMMNQNIYIMSALNHMHYLGESMKIEQVRDGRVVAVLTEDYDYRTDTPYQYNFDPPIEIRPGDEIRATCEYDSTSRDITTRYGEGYLDEMCFGFLTYYPKQALPDGGPPCVTWNSVPTCQFTLDSEIEGCDFVNVHNLADAATKRVYDDVMKHCRPLAPCYKDCLPVVKRIQKRPCYHGDMWRWQRETLLSSADMTDDVRVTWFKFYAAFDSCAAALEEDASPEPNSAWSPYKTSHGALVVALLMCYLVLYK